MQNLDLNTEHQDENRLLAKQEFLQLDKLLNSFNVFEATDMGRREIKHTKFLSYLLDPNESHGLGETFIKNFIIRISTRFNDFPRFFDLDLSFTEITPEFNLTKGSLDCLINIPQRNPGSPSVIIAIENKIGAGQGKGQLENYRNWIHSKFPEQKKFFIFLTFNYEEPNDDLWEHITYQDVVLPSVKATLDMLEDTGSPHLKAILNDYYELMINDADVDKEKDDLAAYLTNEFSSYIKKLKEKISNHRECLLYIKHKKAIKYLTQFDNDARSKILKSWKSLEKRTLIESFEGYDFIIESSIRSHLRFSILTESNRNKLINLSQNSRKWLESKCPLAFEIVVQKVKQSLSFRLILVLGPTDSMDERIKLLNSLAPNKSISDFWNSIPIKFEPNITAQEDRSDFLPNWIFQNVLELGTNPNSIKLNDYIKKIAFEINQRLTIFFDENNHSED
ncbi:PD-(D/E)XK nuclease family protein [Methylotenera sp.]|uniref:PD-(D/E)XK nuclease family protein n=1 Tax=Methylotenera sp. TaxID=2051956 RepID=UPI002733A9F4|nr:PD-(D/E)XK nuclease family protein [Methylotenera sp.]MDP3211930.1 PD-(D/E)XK nuclease family protein [Methylotenera sp.]